MTDWIERMPEHWFDRIKAVARVLAGASLIVLGCLMFAALTACGPKSGLIKPPPVEAKCDALCYLPCVGENRDTGVRWEGDPQSTASTDALEDTVIPLLAEKLRLCDTHRQACVLCLLNLENQKVIIQ